MSGEECISSIEDDFDVSEETKSSNLNTVSFNGGAYVDRKSPKSRIPRISRHHTNSSSKSENIRSVLIPLSRIPENFHGILWTGIFRRTPILIFSVKSLTKRNTFSDKLAKHFNMSFRFVKTECKLLKSILNSHGMQDCVNLCGKFNILWTGCHVKPSQLRILSDFQRINHFPRSYELTRKDKLAKNVQMMQYLRGVRHFDFLPQTFILPNEFSELWSNYLQEKGPFIVKPVASSRGRGIFIVSHPEEIPYDEPLIVSRYITHPYLLDGFKFDVRLYVAVTSYEPLVVYVYEEGLVRFATVRYQTGLRYLKTQCMHLTNYSVNKKNFEFVHNDDPNIEDFGNKWSLGALLRYLKSQGTDVTGLMLRIEDIIIKSFLCVLDPIASACSTFPTAPLKCFELYGFDIIVDQNLRPWLLEVNLSPSLACDSPLDYKIKSHMLTDLLNLVGVVCHDPTRKTHGGTNSLHLTASGDVVIPPGNATYFMTSQKYMAGFQTMDHNSNSYGKLSPHLQGNLNSEGELTGTQVSELLPTCMTADEIKLMRRLQEEAVRAGGWIRLIPHPVVWEQYSSIWPNDSSRDFGAKASYNNEWDSSCTLDSARRATFTGNRHDMSTLLASAFSAAYAVSTLYHITGNLKSRNCTHPPRGEAEAFSLETEEYYHPNSYALNADINQYLKRNMANGQYEDFANSAATVPNATAPSRSRSPLHSMPDARMRQCVEEFVHSSPPSSTRAKDKQILACYLLTLTHMPFYLRKLGELPFPVDGVDLQSPIHSERTLTSLSTQSKSISPAVFCEKKCSLGGSRHNSTATKSPKRGRSPALRGRPKRSASRASSASISSRSDCVIDIVNISAAHARQLFAAYLTKIYTRLMREIKSGTNFKDHTDEEKSEGEVKLLARFLMCVSDIFSQENKTKAATKLPDTMSTLKSLSEGNLLTDKQPLEMRKRKLAKILHMFILRYKRITRELLDLTDMSTRENSAADGNKLANFIEKASESKLEELLTSYTKLHQSVDLFFGPQATPPPMTSRVVCGKDGDTQLNSKKTINNRSDSGFESAEDKLSVCSSLSVIEKITSSSTKLIDWSRCCTRPKSSSAERESHSSKTLTPKDSLSARKTELTRNCSNTRIRSPSSTQNRRRITSKSRPASNTNDQTKLSGLRTDVCSPLEKISVAQAHNRSRRSNGKNHARRSTRSKVSSPSITGTINTNKDTASIRRSRPRSRSSRSRAMVSLYRVNSAKLTTSPYRLTDRNWSNCVTNNDSFDVPQVSRSPNSARYIHHGTCASSKPSILKSTHSQNANWSSDCPCTSSSFYQPVNIASTRRIFSGTDTDCHQ